MYTSPLLSIVATNLALERELGLAVRSHSTPGRLISRRAIVTNGGRLPGLVESLKVESVEAPVKQSAEALLVEVLGVVEAALCGAVVGSDCNNQHQDTQFRNRQFEMADILNTYQQ